MSDKLNLLTSNVIRFIAGERPTADKFNAMNLYYTRSIDNICRAIGDMYDRSSSGPLSPPWNPHEEVPAGRPLDIANLARLIGPASNLNPKMFGASSEIVETFDADFVNNNKELELKYLPELNSGAVELKNSEGTATSLEFVIFSFGSDAHSFKMHNAKTIGLHPELILTPGESIVVTYTTTSLSVQGGINYLNSGWNVIPDPNQAETFTISNAEVEGWDYKIKLDTLSIRNQQSGASSLNSSVIENEVDEYNNAKTYTLPEWWSEKFQGDGIKDLPEGLVYLKNTNTNELYLTAEYGFSDLQTIYVRAATLCLENDHRLVLVGTDITTSIDDLRNKMFNHRHDGSFGEPFIRIQDLVGKFVTGEFGPSSIPGNEFPMYLHRKGYQVDTNTLNGNNAMLGDILMGNVLFNGTSNTDIEGSSLPAIGSYKVSFLNPKTYIQKALGVFVINNTDDAQPGFTDKTLINTGASLHLTQKSLYSESEESTNIGQKNITIGTTDDAHLTQKNIYIDSSDKTHLQINNSDTVVLADNEEDTTTSVHMLYAALPAYVESIHDKEKEWNNNSRKEIAYSNDLTSYNYPIIEFEPSTWQNTLVPTGVITQYVSNTENHPIRNPYLFLNSVAKVTTTVSGEESSVDLAASYTSDEKGRITHDSQADYDSFIFNYRKKVVLSTADNTPEDFGVWDFEIEQADNKDGTELSHWNNSFTLGSDANIEICFGGNNYSEASGSTESHYLPSVDSAGEPVETAFYELNAQHIALAEAYNTRSYYFEPSAGAFKYNRTASPRAEIASEDLHWWGGNSNHSNTDYEVVYNSNNLYFRIIGNPYTNMATNPGSNYAPELLAEINASYGVRATYTPVDENGDPEEKKYSWLVGKSSTDLHDASNTGHDTSNDGAEGTFGVTYDYRWEFGPTPGPTLVAGTIAEFALKLRINPRRLFQPDSDSFIAEKENYTFEVFYRPYNYTRPSLQPTFMQAAARDITKHDSLADGSALATGTVYGYILYSSDYDIDAYPTWINNEGTLQQVDASKAGIDQRVPVGVSPLWVIHGSGSADSTLAKPDAKELIPLSLGVLNEDYHPEISTQIQGLDNAKGIHRSNDRHICRAASTGTSKQSIAFYRNGKFGNNISNKVFYINTDGGNEHDGSFYLSESFLRIEHYDIYASGNDLYRSLRQTLNFYDKPNFILSYQNVPAEDCTFSIHFNGNSIFGDLELSDNLLKDKVINLSTAVTQHYVEHIWFKQYFTLQKYFDTPTQSPHRDTSFMHNWWSKIYGNRSNLLSWFGLQKNWVDFQYSDGIADPRFWINGEDRVHNRTYMPHFIQAILSGNGRNAGGKRCPLEIFGNSYIKDLFFDIKMKVVETYDANMNHLSIDVTCNYIQKHSVIRQLDTGNMPLRSIKRGRVTDAYFYPDESSST